MHTPRLLFIFIVIIALLHTLGILYGWYGPDSWFDIPMHLAGGAFVALLFHYLFGVRHPMLAGTHPLSIFIFAMGFVALIGILWEFYEFLADVFFLQTHSFFSAPPDILSDTLIDLANDLIGGAVATFLLLLRKREWFSG